MAIFILILKIIGIILAVVAALIAFVLLSPITYKTNLEYRENLNFKTKVTYLLHLIYANITYNSEENLHIVVKFLFFTLYDNKKPKKVKKKITDENQEEIKEKKEKRKKTFFEKLKDKFVFVIDKLKLIFTWLDDEHRRLISFLFKEVVKILKKVRPKKFSLYANFGMEEPYKTGRILTVASILIGMTNLPNVVLEPDFEKKVLYVNMKARGHFFILPLIIIGYRIYKNRDFRRFILSKKKKGV